MKSKVRAALGWGFARLLLGVAQMTGAIMSAALLWRMAIVRESLIAVVITMSLTLVSLFLFVVLKVGRRLET